METATMGRKKTDPPDSPRRMVAVTIKGNVEWKEWLEEAATHCRLTVSALVDLAVTEYVREHGYKAPPPPR